MRIDELIQGLPITLLVTINGEQLTFDSKISEVYPKKRFVLVEAIYHNEKIISFKGANLIVDMLVSIENEKPELFKNVTITLVKKSDGSLCYNITSIADSKPYNRRQSFRCFVGRPTGVRYGANRAAHQAILKDVSINGFAVVCDNKLSVGENQVIHVVLSDHFEDPPEKISFHLYGIIARVQELENGSFLYGCRLNNYVPGLESYIMKKERLRLRRTNGGNL